MRKIRDQERSLGGSELALLEEENVDWERVWNRSIAGDAWPASLRELRCVSTLSHVVVRELIFSIKADACTYTIVTLTHALSSSFSHTTQVGTRHRFNFTN